jgi:hypothetical protein
MYIHHVARLVRKQVYITPEQDDLLKDMANREKRSEAEIIRAALDARLRPRKAPPRRLSDDPLWGIIGLGAGESGDVSEHVDHYLYGVSRK